MADVVQYKPNSLAARTESPQAAAAFEDYWRLGRGRSLDLLWKSYEKLPAGPPCSWSTLNAWASMFKWKSRAAQREALAAAEVEKLRRQQVADMESALYQRGMEAINKAADRLEELLSSNRVGAVAAIQLMKLGMEMATRGQRQPAVISREEVVHRDGEPLTMEALLHLLPEDQRDAVLEAAYWELQARGDTGGLQGEVRDAAGPPD